jgi:hypothetical protein
VAVEGGNADAGSPCHLVQRRRGPLLDEDVARSRYHPIAVALRIGAERTDV